MPEIDPATSLGFFIAAIVIQGAGCFYQWWALRRITRIRVSVQEIARQMRELQLAPPKTGDTFIRNGKVPSQEVNDSLVDK